MWDFALGPLVPLDLREFIRRDRHERARFRRCCRGLLMRALPLGMLVKRHEWARLVDGRRVVSVWYGSMGLRSLDGSDVVSGGIGMARAWFVREGCGGMQRGRRSALDPR
jgi:hypothetical protein